MSSGLDQERFSEDVCLADPLHPEDARINKIVNTVTADLLSDPEKRLFTKELLVREAARMAAESAREEF